MQSDRTTSFLVILAIIAALLLGLTVGGLGPATWLRALAGGGGAPAAAGEATATARALGAAMATATATATAPPSATATEEATARPTATTRPTRTATAEPTTTAEATAEPSATAEPAPEPPPPPTEAPPAPEPESAPPPTLAATTRSPVNFREAPNGQSALIASLSGGTPLTILGRNAASTWLRGRLEDGREGWITASATVLAVEGDIGALPVVE